MRGKSTPAWRSLPAMAVPECDIRSWFAQELPDQCTCWHSCAAVQVAVPVFISTCAACLTYQVLPASVTGHSQLLYTTYYCKQQLLLLLLV